MYAGVKNLGDLFDTCRQVIGNQDSSILPLGVTSSAACYYITHVTPDKSVDNIQENTKF